MPSKKKELTHLVQLIVVFLLAVILRYSDPLTQNVAGINYVQHLVPTKIYITQLLDPLKSHFKNTLPSYVTLNKKTQDFEGTAKQFLSSNFYDSDSDSYPDEFLKSLGNKFVSPLTITMLMMGCYGDIQSNTQLKANVTKDSAVLFNVLLQTLEYNLVQHASSDPEVATNDKSACSCLKDFANPQLASAKKQILVSAGKVEDSESNHLHYDSCQSQNLQDFVYNGNYANIGVETIANVNDKPYISMSTDYIARTLLRARTNSKDMLLGQRNRIDPMLYELLQLHQKILDSNRESSLESVKSHLADASFSTAKTAWITSLVNINRTADQVEEQELWKQEMIAAGYPTETDWKTKYKNNLIWTTDEENEKIEENLRLSDIADQFPDLLPMFTNILHNNLQLARQALATQSYNSDKERDDAFLILFAFGGDYDAPKHSNAYNSELKSWNIVYKNTDLIQEKDVQHYTVKRTFTWLQNYIQNRMYAHNKLRAPIFTSNSLNVDSSSQPPVMDSLTYQNYVDKYAAAYKMCSFAGIPAYQTVPRHKIESTTYTHAGNAYLLYSIFVAFVYWNHQSKKVAETLQHEPQDTEESTASGLYDKYKETVYFVVIAGISVFFLVQLILSQLDISNDKLYVEYKNVDDHLKSPKFPLFAGIRALTWIFFLVFLGSIFTLAYKLYRNKDQRLNQSVEIIAQIAMDVGVIAGFATNGIAVFLQRGIGNEYFIVFVFLTLVVTSFLQHLSNVMRLLQQMNVKNEMYMVEYETLKQINHGISQPLFHETGKQSTVPTQVLEELNKEIAKHTGTNVGMNRTLAIMVIIILLAGIGFSTAESYDIMTYDVIYNYNHMWIFLGIVFFVLCAFDILHEVASFAGKAIHPYEQHSQKLLWTAWALVLGLLFLHFHQFIGLCASYEEYEAVEGDSENLCNYPRFLFLNSWHSHYK